MSQMLLELWQNATLLRDHPLLLVGIFVALHIACAVLFLPCSPFAVIAGSVWGIFPGLIISVAAACAATAATFGLGRLARSSAFIQKHLISRVTARMAPMFADRTSLGWAGVFAVQMNPIVPASCFGYVFGMSSMSFWKFITASAVATLPMQIMLVTTSALALDALVSRKLTLYAALALGGCSVLLVAWTVFRLRWAKLERPASRSL